MRKILIFLIMLNLMGCVQSAPTHAIRYVVVDKEESPSAAYELPPPPSPNSPNYSLGTKEGIQSYTTAVNTYMYRIFFYTWMLNRYALDRNWNPPPMEPLCLYADLPPLDEAPDVVISPKDRNAKGIEKTLTEYIKRTRALYEDQKEDYAEFQKLYRRMCTF